MKKLEFIFVFLIVSLLNSADIRIVAEINKSGLIVPTLNDWYLLEQNENVLYRYSYDGFEKESFPISFLPKGERCDWIISNSFDGFYLFCKNSEMLYQTDAKFNLINQIKIKLNQNEKLTPRFYENNSQNLIFYDRKTNWLKVLNQGELKNLWNEPETPDDFFVTHGKILLLYDEIVMVKDENGIRFRDVALPFKPDLCTVYNGDFIALADNRIVVTTIESGNRKEYRFELPTGKSLALFDRFLLYSTSEKIMIIKLDSEE